VLNAMFGNFISGFFAGNLYPGINPETLKVKAYPVFNVLTIAL